MLRVVFTGDIPTIMEFDRPITGEDVENIILELTDNLKCCSIVTAGAFFILEENVIDSYIGKKFDNGQYRIMHQGDIIKRGFFNEEEE